MPPPLPWAEERLLCDPKVAERRTGYVVGGISPLGQKTPPHPPGRKRPALRYHHGVRRQAWTGRRARPDDLLKLTNGKYADIRA